KIGELSEARQWLQRGIDAIPNDPNWCRRIIESGVAPATISLHLLAARPEIEGRIVVAEALLEDKDTAGAAAMLAPLAKLNEVSDEARILAARLFVMRGEGDYESLLSKIPAGSSSAYLADQVRLEAA